MTLGGQGESTNTPDPRQFLSQILTPLEYFSSFENPLLVMELWTVAVVWLLWRLWSVLTAPTELLKSILGRAPILLPEITVDQLGHQWAAVRWRYPAHARHAAKHLVELVGPNGSQRVMETERSQSRMVIEDLEPNTVYHVALYAQPGRRLAAEISLHTMQKAHESAPITEWTQPCSGAYSSTTSNGTSREPLKATEPRTISQIKQEIEQLQADFNKEHQSRISGVEEFETQQMVLQEELKHIAAARRTELSARNQQRGEIKALEDLKHSLDSKRKNEQRRNRELQQALNLQHSTQNRWTTEIGDRHIRLQEKTNKLQKAKEKWGKEHEKLLELSQTLTQEIEQLESKLKERQHELKTAETSRNKTRGLLVKLEKHTDIASGILSNEFKADELAHLTPQEELLIQEFEKDSAIEEEWLVVRETLEKQYISAYQKHEQANRALETAQARAAAQSQAQAQIYANAFNSHSSLSIPRASQPAVSLLPSNLFKDDPPQTPVHGSSGASITHLPPPSPNLGNSQFGYPAWKPVSHLSRDSSIFFSAPASVNDDRGSSVDISPLGDIPFEDDGNEDLLSTPKPGTSSSTTSSPEKFRWARLGKKQGTPTSATNFVRRLSFFRKDAKQDEEA